MRPLRRLAPVLLCLTALACSLPDARILEMPSSAFAKLKSFDEVAGVRVDNSTGGVRVSHAGSELEATLTLYGENTEVEIQVVDAVVVFDTECGPGPCIVDYDVRVPQGWSVTVDNDSGWVDVESLEPSWVVVETGSGTIEISDVSAGSADLDSGSGGITIADLTADTIRLDTGAGAISASAVRTLDLVTSTGSGAVTLGLLLAPDRLVVGTGSGGVHVSLPRGAYDLNLTTGTGGINVDELEDDPESAQKVDISTASGGIQVGPS